MTALSWDGSGQKLYEYGVDHGVLYLPDNSGIAWNGLTSVEEAFDATAAQPLYFDGVKFNQIVMTSDFSGRMKAYTYPDEFLEIEGILAGNVEGIYITGQRPSSFGLSYRTKIGNDIIPAAGYKLHLIRNLNAMPVPRLYKTLAAEAEMLEFEWSLTAIPEDVPGFRPTAHLIFDSTKIDSDILQTVEDFLYGTVSTDPVMPTFRDLITAYP